MDPSGSAFALIHRGIKDIVASMIYDYGNHITYLTKPYRKFARKTNFRFTSLSLKNILYTFRFMLSPTYIWNFFRSKKGDGAGEGCTHGALFGFARFRLKKVVGVTYHSIFFFLSRLLKQIWINMLILRFSNQNKSGKQWGFLACHFNIFQFSVKKQGVLTKGN